MTPGQKADTLRRLTALRPCRCREGTISMAVWEYVSKRPGVKRLKVIQELQLLYGPLNLTPRVAQHRLRHQIKRMVSGGLLTETVGATEDKRISKPRTLPRVVVGPSFLEQMHGMKLSMERPS